MDIHSLDRFIEVQERMYAVALEEIKSGLKRSHWMWYIFPQLRGLGTSSMAHVYGIAGLDEARAYLSHPVLSARLIEISEALLMLKKKNPEDIFGHTDAMKLRSSMTLFALVSDDGSVFHEVLEWFYNGKMDERTLELIKSQLSDDEQIDFAAKCILKKYRKAFEKLAK